MADEVAPVNTTPPAVAASPAIPSIATAPVESTPSPAVSSHAAPEGAAPATPPSLAVEPTPDKEILKTDGAPEASKTPETVKAEEKSPVETANQENKSPEAVGDGEKKEEGSQSAETAPLPSYEAFTLPEGFTADTEKLGQFTKELAEFEIASKADHAATQSLGQKLMDRHIAEVKEALDRQTKTYSDYWEKQKTTWRESFISDPEIGGNRMNTTIEAGRNIITNYGGTSEQQQELRNVLISSGLDAHPGLIRLLNNVSKSPLVQEGKPLPANKPAIKQSKTGKWYGGSAA